MASYLKDHTLVPEVQGTHSSSFGGHNASFQVSE